VHRGNGLYEPWTVTVSPDDRHVYVVAVMGSRMAILTRNANGSLTSAGCIGASTSDGNVNVCTAYSALAGVNSIAFSPGTGAHAYASAQTSNAVAILSRNDTTALSPRWPAPRGASARAAAVGPAWTEWLSSARATSQ
jgi:hypothetical protein